MFVLLALASAAVGAAPQCGELLPDAMEIHHVRTVTPVDLATLRDIGRPDDSLYDSAPFSVSPDGKRIAFQVRRAVPATNSYCIGMAVMDLAAGSRSRLIDIGGEPVKETADIRGNVDVPLGTMTVITPYWSADGRTVSYLRREAGSTQIWRTALDRRPPHQVTRLPVDVEKLDRSNDEGSLSFSYRPAKLTGQRNLDREGRRGFLFDDRFVPVNGMKPYMRAPLPAVFGKLNLVTGAVVGGASVSDFRPSLEVQLAAGLRSINGAVATLIATNARGSAPPRGLAVTFALGTKKTCSTDCQDITGLWWFDDGREVIFVRREGWAENGMAIYRWRSGELAPRRILNTTGLLVGCQPARDNLVCAFETASRPRRIIAVARRTGAMRTVFDPNPEFATLITGKIRRLTWSLKDGTPVFADLVLPVGYRKGQRYPLVVVQYQSRGFLRGGTGDEYPIQALAGRGYLVLSLQQPRNLTMLAQSPDPIAYDRLVRGNWWLRRRLLEVLEGGVRHATTFGADPNRMGITGVSDGTSTVIYALANSRLQFKAAVISSCCDDPATFGILGGPAFATVQRSIGYPSWGGYGDPWDRYALSRNRHVSTPILMHAADSEAGYALESEAALRARHVPVELRIFPDERHVKWQPSHRVAIYDRTLDWLDFWIRGAARLSAEDLDQADRWHRMRCEAIAYGVMTLSRSFSVSKPLTIARPPIALTGEARCPATVHSAPSTPLLSHPGQ